MDELQIIDVFSDALSVAIMIIGALILPGLVVGLIIAMFQAATQINEMSLSFIPKLLVTLLAIGFLAPWVHKIMTNFTVTLYREIPYLIG